MIFNRQRTIKYHECLWLDTAKSKNDILCWKKISIALLILEEDWKKIVKFGGLSSKDIKYKQFYEDKFQFLENQINHMDYQ